ncbi:MAG TPA: glycoside hydrolase family 43 protein [Chloroflexia bacterium]
MMPPISSARRTAGSLAACVLALFILIACDSQNNSGPTPTATISAQFIQEAEATQAAIQAIATQTAPVAESTNPPASPTTQPPAGDTFTNPVLRSDFPDPFVLKEGDTYYAYATNGSGKNIQAATSTDLVNWKVLSDVMPALAPWAKLGGSYVWAPEVTKIGEKYLLYYTARDKASNKQCVGVATADKPEGKFKDTSDKALVCQAQEGGTIDASPFQDGDKHYLYFKNDGNCCGIATYLYVQELAPDGLSLVGEPTRLVRNDRQWEGAVVEAPTMWKQDGKYYLFFSANSYAGFEYAVGYANCDSPMGPCTDAPENPILASRMKEKPLVIGPGHQTIVQDKEGDIWLVYHVWEVNTSGMRGNSRFMWIDPLEWQEGKPVVKGPTTNPQPLP